MGWVVVAVLVAILAAILFWAYLHRRKVIAQAEEDKQAIRQSVVRGEKYIGDNIKGAISKAESDVTKELDKARGKLP